jgi:hypothetical protein
MQSVLEEIQHRDGYHNSSERSEVQAISPTGQILDDGSAKERSQGDYIL